MPNALVSNIAEKIAAARIAPAISVKMDVLIFLRAGLLWWLAGFRRLAPSIGSTPLHFRQNKLGVLHCRPDRLHRVIEHH